MFKINVIVYGIPSVSMGYPGLLVLNQLQVSHRIRNLLKLDLNLLESSTDLRLFSSQSLHTI